MKDISVSGSPALSLLNAEAVRDRTQILLEKARTGPLMHTSVDFSRMASAAARVVSTAERTYPDRQFPPYSIWRNLEAGDVDRWGMLVDARGFDSPEDMARSAFDLAIVTALLGDLDGEGWCYDEVTTGQRHCGRDGLAVAVFNLFAAGVFSADPADPMRADAHALIRLEPEELAANLAAADGTALPDGARRIRRLVKLGEAAGLRPDLFSSGDVTRPGMLFDRLTSADNDSAVQMPAVLDKILDGFGPIWPDNHKIGDVGLGDTATHPDLLSTDATSGFLPLHARAQFLACSLIEPLAWAGIACDGFNRLTGIGDREHVRFMLDCELIVLEDPELFARPVQADHAAVAELRGLTIALTDLLATKVRHEMGAEPEELPLVCLMEAGIRTAAREIALEKRGNLTFPLRILSDSTVF